MKNQSFKQFRFTSFNFNEERGILSLNYSLDDKIEFCEEFIFKSPFEKLNQARKNAFYEISKLLHLAAGISYYKTFIPNEITIKPYEIDKETANFFNIFYKKGLGEFCYRNNIKINPKFPYKESISPQAIKNIFISDNIAVPIGGGKDSSLALSMLESKGFTPIPIAVGRPKAIKDIIEISTFPSIHIERKISKNLLELNEKGALNGHIPITGVFAFLLALSGILYNFKYVAMSNERSANVGNTISSEGLEVNHQWSKSFEFEVLFDTLIKKFIPDFHYFSILRPFSELEIARRFAKLKKYHQKFTSCNNAFKIREELRSDKWCCNCPKCRFVFLSLAPFLSKEELTNIFGKNLLDDETQLQGFKELLGLENFKPFECVGEIEESQTAFNLLLKKSEWQEDFIIKTLKNKVLENFKPEISDKIFSISKEHNIPKELIKVLDAFK